MEGYTKSTYNGRDVPEWASFRDESQIEKVIIETEIVLQNIQYWFYNCTKLTEIQGIEKLDTSNVTNMTNLFYNCKSLKSLDLRNFNTSKTKGKDMLIYVTCPVYIGSKWSLTEVETGYSGTFQN